MGSMSSSDQELEVKFYLSRREEAEQKLVALGGLLAHPRVHEVNLRFDTPDLSLLQEGKLLRLRKDSRVRLTFKGVGSEQGGVRLRQELEITVSDYDTTRKLVEALGFQVQMMYEKYRTTYRLGETEVALDEMPTGDFLEIEGPDSESIKAVSRQLGLNWSARILDSYTVLFERTRVNLGFGFRDLSFANFEGIKVGPQALGVKFADSK